MSSSLLYSNAESTIILVDIPRSIEFAQGFSSPSPRLLSSLPLAQPFPSLEPKSAKGKANLHIHDIPVDDLLTQKLLSLSLEELKGQCSGPWCLPRVNEDATKGGPGAKGKRKVAEESINLLNQDSEYILTIKQDTKSGICLHQNPRPGCATTIDSHGKLIYFPPKSTALCGSIENTTAIFLSSAPKFNIITLDPPWPNRSAHRKDSYTISYNTLQVQNLLSTIPIQGVLVDNGLIAVWITNKPAFRDMVVSDGGLFDHWGVTLIEEWIWLKTTNSGVPVSAIDGVWRKPYEILLVGRKSSETEDVRKRVIVGVPDLHSRKPNLKEMMEQIFGFKAGVSQGLEVFARNLTEGWWAWGDECLKFQSGEHWIDPSAEEKAEQVEH